MGTFGINVQNVAHGVNFPKPSSYILNLLGHESSLSECAVQLSYRLELAEMFS